MKNLTLEMKESLVGAVVNSLLVAYSSTELNVSEERIKQIAESMEYYTHEDGKNHLMTDALHGHTVDIFRFMHELKGYSTDMKNKKLERKLETIRRWRQYYDISEVVSELTIISIIASLMERNVIGKFDDTHNIVFLMSVYLGWIYV